jgi:hypothetical protein
MQTEDTATGDNTPYGMATVWQMGKKPDFIRNNHIARPFLVAYRANNNRWYLYGARSLEEAENKIASLLKRNHTKMCILSRVMYDARSGDNEQQQEE